MEWVGYDDIDSIRRKVKLGPLTESKSNKYRVIFLNEIHIYSHSHTHTHTHIHCHTHTHTRKIHCHTHAYARAHTRVFLLAYVGLQTLLCAHTCAKISSKNSPESFTDIIDKEQNTSIIAIGVFAQAAYIREKGLAGVMLWTLDDDDYDNFCGKGRFPVASALQEALPSDGERWSRFSSFVITVATVVLAKRVSRNRFTYKQI